MNFTESITPICKDCAFCRRDRFFDSWWRPTYTSWKHAKCAHPKANNEGYHLVTGIFKEATESCYIMRLDFEEKEHCGKQGRWFEPK